VLLNIALCQWPNPTINQLLIFQHSNNSTNMLELKIQCDTADEINIYTNAIALHNLLGDLCNALRSAYKHGDDKDALKVVQDFYPDIIKAVDHCQGPY
jgi:hypothetical protein